MSVQFFFYSFTKKTTTAAVAVAAAFIAQELCFRCFHFPPFLLHPPLHPRSSLFSAYKYTQDVPIPMYDIQIVCIKLELHILFSREFYFYLKIEKNKIIIIIKTCT